MAENKAQPNDFAYYNGVVAMSHYSIENPDIKSIKLAAQKLAVLFEGSDLYKNYCLHKKAIEQDPLLMERVINYRKNQIELETKRLRDGTVSFAEEKQVAILYTELSLHPIAGDFLACEYELLELYRNVLDIISDACKIGF
ncbi:MAG: YlbF family regulator [Defluviitaleaceae bacterium]|nr:YlbF family regulator [Defluviitaleaceae bacterium]